MLHFGWIAYRMLDKFMNLHQLTVLFPAHYWHFNYSWQEILPLMYVKKKLLILLTI